MEKPIEQKTIDIIKILLSMQSNGELNEKETIDGIKRLINGRG